MHTRHVVARNAAILAVVALIVAFSPNVTHAYTARISWTPVEGAAGYHVYVRQNSDAFGAPHDIGMQAPDGDGIVRYEIDGLDAAKTQRFVVASYDGANDESPRSNERTLTYADVAAVVDSDSDGLSDAEEDVDLDRVVDARETDPHAADTDGDGLGDGAEVAAGSNPLDPNDPVTTRPTVAPTARPTATRTATPVPTATPTVTDAATSAPTAAPTSAAPVAFEFPLDGWRAGKSNGTWQVVANRNPDGDVLVTETSAGDAFNVVYPPRADLAVALPIGTFSLNADAGAGVTLVVRATDGRAYRLKYRVGSGVPLVHRREATFLLEDAAPAGVWATVTRDLAADLRTAFGASFHHVQQGEVAGAVRLAEIVLTESGSGAPAPVAATMTVPFDGWTLRGRGTSTVRPNDPALGAATLATVPANADQPRVALEFPARGSALVAAFGTVSFVVADDRALVVEVRVRTSAGVARVRYVDGALTAVVKGRVAQLPLVREPIAGTAFDLVTLDLAADVAAAFPGRTLASVTGLRLSGAFRIGALELQDPLALP